MRVRVSLNDPFKAAHDVKSALDEISESVFPFGDSGSSMVVEEKGRNDFVTNKDKEVDCALTEFLEARFGHQVFSEERRHVWPPSQDIWWVIDPVDGTHNLGAGWPIFGVMGALLVYSVPTFGFIYFPYAYGGRREMCWAAAGMGAWVLDSNLRRVFVSRNAAMGDSFVLFEGPTRKMFEVVIGKARELSGGIRINLSCSVSFVSLARDLGRGRPVAGVLSLNNKPWDNLPAVPVIEEAGGFVSDLQGNPVTADNATSVIAANNEVNYQIFHSWLDEYCSGNITPSDSCL